MLFIEYRRTAENGGTLLAKRGLPYASHSRLAAPPASSVMIQEFQKLTVQGWFQDYTYVLYQIIYVSIHPFHC